MNICICGWYLGSKELAFLDSVNKVNRIHLVNHNIESYSPHFLYGFGVSEIPNIGLEFGAYDYYLKNIWDRKSSVLFMHDDFVCTDVNLFSKLNKDMEDKGIDQSYIFRDKVEEKQNAGKHGRGIYMSMRLLLFILNNNRSSEQSFDHYDSHNPDTKLIGTGSYCGFWYDKNNLGHTSGKPPKGVRHYNESIYTFHREMGRIRDRRYGNEAMNVVNRCYYPELLLGRRGMIA